MKKIKWRVGKDQAGNFIISKSKGAYKTAVLYMISGYVYRTPYRTEAQEIADKLNEEEK